MSAVPPTRSTALTERTSFVGRRDELADLGRRFADGARLVTVAGPPGSGKTRLARAYARESLARDQGAVVFCDLTEARDADEVAAVVAHALHVAPPVAHQREDLVADVARRLAAGPPALLVLDNFDRVVQHAPATVGRWLDAAPVARFLVTSRQRLALPGESCAALGPLPDGDAVELFVARARAIRGDFTAGPSTRAVMLELVRRLDGLPLAIELASARVNVLTPRALLARLSSRFEVLKGPSGELPDRHSTLLRALEDSWDALPDAGRAALAQSSVFRGGFSLEAAEGVFDLAGACDGGSAGASVLDVLEGLVDRSLVRRVDGGDGPAAEEPRFNLYESVRDFAAAKLAAAGAKSAAEARHAAYFAAAGEGWARAARALEGALHLERIALEADNLIAAHERALSRDPAVAGRALLALDPLAQTRGPLAAHVTRLGAAAEALAGAQGVDALQLRARLLVARGTALMYSGSWQQAAADLAAGNELATAADAGDTALEAQSVLMLVLQWQGQFDEALSASGGASAHEEADPGTQSRVLRALGALHLTRGQLEESWGYLERAVDAARRAGDRPEEGTVLAVLGLAYHERGRLRDARVMFERALGVLRDCGHGHFEAVTRMWIGLLNFDEGDTPGALASVEDALARLESVGDVFFRTGALGYRGVILHALGRSEEALASLEASLDLARMTRDPYRLGLFLFNHAAVLLARGDAHGARASFDAARPFTNHANPNLAGLADVVSALFVLHEGRPDAAARARTARDAARNPRTDARGEISLPPAAYSSDVRFALKFLDEALARFDAPDTSADPANPAPASTAPPALVVGPGARWFTPPGGARVDLSRRGALQRVLQCLVDARARTPGSGASTLTLLEAGWPDERVLIEAGVHRVHVAIATLRKWGLGGLLVRQHDGYLLAPEARVEVLPG